jgi:hypothetical protein
MTEVQRHLCIVNTRHRNSTATRLEFQEQSFNVERYRSICITMMVHTDNIAAGHKEQTRYNSRGHLLLHELILQSWVPMCCHSGQCLLLAKGLALLLFKVPWGHISAGTVPARTVTRAFSDHHSAWALCHMMRVWVLLKPLSRLPLKQRLVLWLPQARAPWLAHSMNQPPICRNCHSCSCS